MAENTADIAKRIILTAVAEGMTVEQAVGSAGKSMKTYEYYRRTDKVFADKMDRTRLGLKEKQYASADVHDIDFATFRKRFLHQNTFGHQQNLVDVIEGRQPSWLHPSMKYEKGTALTSNGRATESRYSNSIFDICRYKTSRYGNR